MSQTDSKDEEKGTILEPEKSNDSEESKTPQDTDTEEYDYDDRDPLKHEEMDDKEW